MEKLSQQIIIGNNVSLEMLDFSILTMQSIIKTNLNFKTRMGSSPRSLREPFLTKI